MNQLKAVIFDMDGVICHTNPHHSQAFRVFFDKRGIYPTNEEFAEHMYGKSNGYIFSHFFGRKVEREELLDFENEKEAEFRSIYQSQIEEVRGFAALVTDLRKNGYRLGVATSAPYANLELILSGLGLQDFFDSVLASEDVTRHKPDPEVYLRSAQNLDVLPQNCIVFEDSFSGVSAALNAGMRVVGVLTSHKEEELPPCNRYVSDYVGLNSSVIDALLK